MASSGRNHIGSWRVRRGEHPHIDEGQNITFSATTHILQILTFSDNKPALGLKKVVINGNNFSLFFLSFLSLVLVPNLIFRFCWISYITNRPILCVWCWGVWLIWLGLLIKSRFKLGFLKLGLRGEQDGQR